MVRDEQPTNQSDETLAPHAQPFAAANAEERIQFRRAVHVHWPGVADLLSLGRTTRHAMPTPRKVALPVVIGVCVITVLVATYTCAMLPWFRDYCDYYQSSGTIRLAGIARAFLSLHLVGVPFGLFIIGYGVRLLRPAETSAAHLAWYASVSVGFAAFWQVWAMLAERSLYALLFPA